MIPLKVYGFQMALEAFIQSIFRPENYAANAILVKDITTGQVILTLPDGLSRKVRLFLLHTPDSNDFVSLGV